MSQRKFTEHLQAQFFDLIGGVIEKKGRHVAQSYFYILRPMNDSSAAAVSKYSDLLAKVMKETPDNTFFIKLLKSTIDDLQVMEKGREASRTWLSKK